MRIYQRKDFKKKSLTRVIVHKFTMDTIQKEFFILYKSMWGWITEDVHEIKQTVKKNSYQFNVRVSSQWAIEFTTI